MPGCPTDQSCPAFLSSIFSSHANSRLVGVWPGRPTNLSSPGTLILLLHGSFVQATSFTSILYSASSTTSISRKFDTIPPDYKSKMSGAETDKESGKNEWQIPDTTGSTQSPLFKIPCASLTGGTVSKIPSLDKFPFVPYSSVLLVACSLASLIVLGSTNLS